MPLLKSSVTSLNWLTTNYLEVVCQPSRPLNFHPGQYIIVQINPDRLSQYSLASVPGETTFTLLIDVSPGGESSQYFRNLQLGDALTHQPPLGQFIFHPDDSSQLLFLATGTGIAPLLAMIKQAVLSSIPIYLLFGLRHESDIIYRSQFQSLHQKFSHFNYLICLSNPAASWTGAHGYITDHLSNFSFNWLKTSTYLCGSPHMIKDAEEILLNLQVPPGNIYTEKYWLK